MATQIYKTYFIETVDGKQIEISPLKIKYLRLLMDCFSLISHTKNDDEAIIVLSECVQIAMKQFCPEIKTIEDVEDNFDLKTIYKILDYCAGIKINENKEETVSKQANENQEKSSWEELDLAKLESEIFLLGIWKNFEELELAISLQELMAVISRNRELDYEEKKFLAAMQGVDLEKDSDKGQKEWEDLKARVFSGGKTSDSNDILALQGQNAVNVGFGIGMGLDYEDLT